MHWWRGKCSYIRALSKLSDHVIHYISICFRYKLSVHALYFSLSRISIRTSVTSSSFPPHSAIEPEPFLRNKLQMCFTRYLTVEASHPRSKGEGTQSSSVAQQKVFHLFSDLARQAVITATYSKAGRSRTLFPSELWGSCLFDVFGQTFLLERPSQ